MQKHIGHQSKQRGFIVLLIMMMLVVGAAVWFGTISGLRAQNMQIQMHNMHIRELHQIKQKMLTFAVMQPEIYYSEISGSPDFDEIPGIGYFPCPDKNGNGLPNDGFDIDGIPIAGVVNNCGSSDGFVTGIVPIKSSDNRYTFVDNPIDSNLYWFSVDSRFVTSNSISTHRFLPLNSISPANANLTVDGRNDIVMVLFYAGDPLAGQNRSSLSQSNYLDQGNADDDENFFTKDGAPDVFNDYVISITLEEWRAALLSRVGKDVTKDDDGDGIADDDNNNDLPDRGGNNVPDLCESNRVKDNANHWFNRCAFIAGSADFIGDCDLSALEDNFNGQNWHEFFCE